MGFVDWVLFGWMLTLGLLGLATCGVVIYSRNLAVAGGRASNTAAATGKPPPSSGNGPRELVFYAAEGCPKTFLQRGYRHFFLGRLLTALWVFVMVISFVMMVALAVCTYFPEVAEALDTDWNGITGAFIITFFIFHTMAILLIELYSTIVVSLMLPSSPADASHLMIEEALPAALVDDKMVGLGDTDEDPTPGLAKRFLVKFRQFVDAYRRTRCRTLLRIEDDHVTAVRTIEYTCVRYRYDSTIDAFTPAAEGIKFTPAQARQRLLDGGLSDDECSNFQRLVGRNEIGVQLPSVFMSLVDEFSTVFYVIQSMGCWVDLGYSLWNIGGICFTVMLITGAVKALVVVRPQKKKLHELAKHKTNVNALRDGRWQTIESTEVVLGDVLRLEEQHELVCDGYVIDGTAVLNEAALTGEPMPVQKVAVEKSSTVWDARNIVHAGTLCVKSSGSSADDEAVMIVSAIGGLTAKGKMIRIVMFPEPVRFKYHDQLPLVYLGLFLYALLLSVAYFALTRIGNWVVTILQVMVAVKQSINPMLPVAMVMGQTVAAKRLRNHHKIFCLQPERIPVAGKISVMVFDKTGTITKDGMELSGVLPAQNGKLGNRLYMTSPSTPSTLAETLLGKSGDTEGLTEELRRGLACCHSVVRLRDGSLSGDQVEIAMLNASGWTLSDKDEVVITSPDGCTQLSVLRRMHFQRETMTSGCVVQAGIASDDNGGSLTVFVKGSAESIMKCCTTVPDTYIRVCEELAAENLYVLAMASKSLPTKVTVDDVMGMKRSDLETGLSLVGLLLFKNEVKSDSALAIKMLKDGDIRSVVCTGDNALTAIGISKEVGIIDYNKPILLANINNQQQVTWIDVTNNDNEGNAAVEPVKGIHQLVVTRSVWRYLINNKEQLDKYWYDIKVYARMKPSDKVSVIKSLQSRKLVVGMCGDGGNDCGALRAAHAAMALSEAEASMVSPFSSSRDSSSLITVVDLIREGRACLTTNLATYSYYIVYAFVLTGVRISGTIIGNNNLGEWVYLMTDLLLGVGMVWTMTLSGPTKHLAPYRPTASLLGWRTILACAVPIVCSYLCQIIAYAVLWSSKNSDWYYYVNTLDLNIQAKDWTKKGDNYDSAVQVFVLLVILVTHCYTASYGGAFRSNILRNWSLNIFYLAFTALSFALLWVDPCDLSCVYRVSCDSGASLATGEIPFVSQFSVGNIGGCFLGTQIHRYQLLGFPNWTPDASENCLPPAEALSMLPYDSPEISTLGYDGPNNVFSTGYRIDYTIVLGCAVLFLHLFVKVGLLGPVAALFRRWQRSRKAKPSMPTA